MRHRTVVFTILAAAALTGACGSDLLLGVDADQGIDGLALLGPHCPVLPVDGSCPDTPYAGWVRILDGGGSRVTRIRAGDDGRFRVGLEPGVYTVEGESGDPFPGGDEETVTVSAGSWVSVTLHFDTGIR